MTIDLWQPLAGLGLFLFAMHLIEESLQAVSGNAFRRFIRRNTERPLQGIAAGTLATGVLQSSSLVGLMTLAMVGAGVMRLKNALGIIFGANLGTTATGWIVATVGFKLDLDTAALPLIGIGGTLLVALSSTKLKTYARFTLGIGLLLLGLSFMKSAVGDIGEWLNPEALTELSAGGYLLFGIVFSAIVQSSSATMMITLSALHGGILNLPDAAAIVIGADLGTTGTLLLGAVKGNAAKKRVAAGHLFFNLITDLIAFALLGPLLTVVSWFALSDLLSLVAFHSLFNLLGIMLFLPFVSRFAAILEGRFVEKPQRISTHLLQEALKEAETAVEAVELETAHLLKRVIEQNLRAFSPPISVPLVSGIEGLPTGAALDQSDRQFLLAYERSKRLEGEILAFTTTLQAERLSAEQAAAINRCQSAVRDAIHASKNLKDVQEDLRTMGNHAGIHLPRYEQSFRDAQAVFYRALLTFKRPANRQLAADDFVDLTAQATDLHAALHSEIYADVRADLVDEHEVSILLNVNRELFNSNLALIQSLAQLLLSDSELDLLERAG